MIVVYGFRQKFLSGSPLPAECALWNGYSVGNDLIMFDLKSDTDSRLKSRISFRINNVERRHCLPPDQNENRTLCRCERCGFTTRHITDYLNTNHDFEWVAETFAWCPLCGKEVAKNESGV